MFIKSIKFFIGLIILFGYYFLSVGIIKYAHIAMPPAILGLVLFALSLIFGVIKSDWVKTTCKFFLNNMAVLFVPFLGGLIVYESVLLKNWLQILLIIFISTTVLIILTGLFVEYGIKFLRLHRMRKNND